MSVFLYNHWYIVGFRRDLTSKPRRVIVAGLPLALYRLNDGSAVALEDRCPHREVPLSMGSVQSDGTLQCLYHGIRFDKHGACKFIPEDTRIPAGAQVRSFPVREHGEWVWVFMGDPALASTVSPPDYPWFTREGWKARTGHLHVKCNYKLIVDNLLNMRRDRRTPSPRRSTLILASLTTPSLPIVLGCTKGRCAMFNLSLIHI